MKILTRSINLEDQDIKDNDIAKNIDQFEKIEEEIENGINLTRVKIPNSFR